MENKVPNEAMIRDYLLGRLDSDAALVERIDELMLGDPQFSESIDVIEDEIIEEYLEGALDPDDNAAVESHFLRPPERQLKLRQARLLTRRILATARGSRDDEETKAMTEHQFSVPVLRQSRLTSKTYVAIAALILLSVSAAYLMQSRLRLQARLRQSTQNLVQEHEHSADLSQQLQVVRALAQPATVMLSLVQSGLSRGDAIVPELRVGPGTVKIHVEIALPPVRESHYAIRLEPAGGTAWHLERIQALSSPDGSILMFDVPAQVFTQGENRFVVRLRNGSEITYFFVISKE